MILSNYDIMMMSITDPILFTSPYIYIETCSLTSHNQLNYSGAAAKAAELRKHTQNDSKCAELSWKCIALVEECYGAWDPEALKAFSQVATHLAIRGNTSKSMALADHFGCLSYSLIRANARAILSRSYSHLVQQVDELVCNCLYMYCVCGCCVL